MAKVSRSVLKEIVKECLLEILFEGIDSESGYEEEEPIREARQPRRTSRPSKNHTVNKRRGRNQKPKKPALQENYVNSAVEELTEDPMMASIFADTAKTTLQEQREGRRPPADNAAAAVDSVEDMGDLFTGADNWAAIAFNEVDK